ncbi:hypothetical protein S83_000607 [Arachis hypogaea]
MSRRGSRIVYVGNLPGDIREREVEDLFSKNCITLTKENVKGIIMVYAKGIAMVEVTRTPLSAYDATEILKPNGDELNSRERLMEEPAAYGKLGLANLLEMREECLREFQFVDAYGSIKQRYTLFWIMLLLSKLAFSYYEEISRLTFNVKLDAADAI